MKTSHLIGAFIVLWITSVIISTSSYINVRSWWLIESKLPILIGITVFNTYITLIHAKIDSRLRIRSHLSRALIRLIYMILIGWLLWIEDNDIYWLVLFQMTLFGMTFNFAYNQFRIPKHHILYMGKTALIDRIFRKIPLVYYSLLFMLMIFSVLIYL